MLNVQQYLFALKKQVIVDIPSGDKIIVLGAAGSGKSVALDYLLRNPLESVKIKGHFKKVIQRKQPVSRTQQQTEHLQHGFIELNLQSESNSMEQNILEYIQQYQAYRAVSSIKAVMVNIDTRALIGGGARGSHLRSLYAQMHGLITHQANTARSVFLLFNRLDSDISVRDIVEYFTEIKAELEANLAAEMSPSQRQELQQQIDVVNYMLMMHAQYVFIDPLDNGESRQIILAKITQAPKLSKEFFALRTPDRIRLMENAITTTVSEAKEHLKVLVESPQQLLSTTRESEQTRDRLTQIQYKIEQLSASSEPKLGSGVVLEQDTSDAINTLREQLVELKSDEPVRYWHEMHDISQLRPHSNNTVQVVKQLQYHDLPYTHYTVSLCNGEVILVDSNQDTGQLHLMYRCDPNLAGKIEVAVYVKRCLLPEVQQQIAQIEQQIATLATPPKIIEAAPKPARVPHELPRELAAEQIKGCQRELRLATQKHEQLLTRIDDLKQGLKAAVEQLAAFEPLAQLCQHVLPYFPTASMHAPRDYQDSYAAFLANKQSIIQAVKTWVEVPQRVFPFFTQVDATSQSAQPLVHRDDATVEPQTVGQSQQLHAFK